jgi:hypothetical protein
MLAALRMLTSCITVPLLHNSFAKASSEAEITDF